RRAAPDEEPARSRVHAGVAAREGDRRQHRDRRAVRAAARLHRLEGLPAQLPTPLPRERAALRDGRRAPARGVGDPVRGGRPPRRRERRDRAPDGRPHGLGRRRPDAGQCAQDARPERRQLRRGRTHPRRQAPGDGLRRADRDARRHPHDHRDGEPRGGRLPRRDQLPAPAPARRRRLPAGPRARDHDGRDHRLRLLAARTRREPHADGPDREHVVVPVAHRGRRGRERARVRAARVRRRARGRRRQERRGAVRHLRRALRARSAMSAGARERSNLLLGVDIGGTFTDIVAVDEEGGITVAKTRSTPADYSQGVLDGLRKIGVEGPDIGRFVHGTTAALNAILTKSGAPTGLLTTAGFRDVLEIRRGDREQLFDYWWRPPAPLVPRNNRLAVRERVGFDGVVVEPLHEEDVLHAVARFRARGLESVAICFLNSFVNPEHERRAKELVEEAWPDAYVCASADILPEILEFERTSTTVANAYVGPIMRGYLGELVSRVDSLGYAGDFLVMASAGHVTTAAEAFRAPI